jgi:hypothetical protein
MKYTFLNVLFLLCISICLPASILNAGVLPSRSNQTDSVIELKEFKAYLKIFFQAVRSNDTNFIKGHTIFPVVNSTVSSRRIDQRYFMKHLPDFFPRDLIKRTNKEGKCVIAKPTTTGERGFIVTVYDTSQGTDANYSWIFVRKQKGFYFVTFRAEVG